MTYVLDTDVLSAIVKGDEAAVRRLLSLQPGEVLVPQPVVAEVRYGLARLARSRRRAALEKRVGVLLRAMPRAEWTDDVSRRFGEVKAELERRGRRLEDFDLAIASHALALDATLATANVRHYERVTNLRIEDWTAPADAS